MSLLLSSGAYDLRAIMRLAHTEARAAQAHAAALGFAAWPYALRLKQTLRTAWLAARCEHEVAVEDARLAAMTPEVASLLREQAIALHIDSLPAMTRELAAIDARAAALGVRL